MQSEYRDRGQSNLGMNLGIIFLNKIYKQEKGIGTEKNLEMFIGWVRKLETGELFGAGNGVDDR